MPRKAADPLMESPKVTMDDIARVFLTTAPAHKPPPPPPKKKSRKPAK